MRRVAIAGILILLAWAGWAEGEGLGGGTPFTVPAACGMSVRHWGERGLGGEGDVGGTASGRALRRLAQPELAGFYLALPSAHSLTVNVAFGSMRHREAGVGRTFGSGTHFYFGC